MGNLLLEQYGYHRLNELRQSPYSCLMDSHIEQTPHQVEAFIAALQALKSGGIILADEVGLGKTIEAGLVLKYLIRNDARRIIIAMPPAVAVHFALWFVSETLQLANCLTQHLKGVGLGSKRKVRKNYASSRLCYSDSNHFASGRTARIQEFD